MHALILVACMPFMMAHHALHNAHHRHVARVNARHSVHASNKCNCCSKCTHQKGCNCGCPSCGCGK